MTYSHRLTIAAPVAMIDTANSIARSMDPDVGGYQSFSNVRATKNNVEYVICDVWVRESFAQQANLMLYNPAILYSACLQDYSYRWVDLVSPSLQECELFINSSIIHIEQRSDKPLSSLLQELDMVLIVAQNNE